MFLLLITINASLIRSRRFLHLSKIILQDWVSCPKKERRGIEEKKKEEQKEIMGRNTQKEKCQKDGKKQEHEKRVQKKEIKMRNLRKYGKKQKTRKKQKGGKEGRKRMNE